MSNTLPAATTMADTFRREFRRMIKHPLWAIYGGDTSPTALAAREDAYVSRRLAELSIV